MDHEIINRARQSFINMFTKENGLTVVDDLPDFSPDERGPDEFCAHYDRQFLAGNYTKLDPANGVCGSNPAMLERNPDLNIQFDDGVYSRYDELTDPVKLAKLKLLYKD